MTTAIPEGFKQNAQGDLVRIDNIKPIDLFKDEVVREMAAKTLEVQGHMRNLRNDLLDTIEAFVETSVDEYGAKRPGGEKGNVTLFSFDGEYKVVRQVAEYVTFDEKLLAAKTLIDECLLEWSENAPADLQTVVNNTFQVNKAGAIRTGAILGLRRYGIKHEKWLRAMDAISDAVMITGSRSFVRLYKRDHHGDYKPIALDIAKL